MDQKVSCISMNTPSWIQLSGSPAFNSPFPPPDLGRSARLSLRQMKAHLQTPPRLRSDNIAPSTVWFGEPRSTEIGLVGGKGASLSILQSVPGIKVPEGFIVTTELYKQFIRSNSALQEDLACLDDLSDAWVTAMLKSKGLITSEIRELETQISAASDSIRKRFLESSIEPQMTKLIIEQYGAISTLAGVDNIAVAVRSSATAEDLPNASFAGQHDTFLNQKGEANLLHSVVGCWASLFHPHTVQYRNQLRLSTLLDQGDVKVANSLRHTEVGLAVVVQRSLTSSVAGVGFNVNPSGEPKIHIEANYGLGETVVSGIANPDSWETGPEAESITSSAIGDKEIKAIAKDNGDVEYLPVPEIDRYRFVIDNDRALEIAKSIKNIGEHYQKLFGYKYIDTEFAIDQHGTLYFVQARPETVFSSSTAMTVMGVPKELAAGATILFHGGSNGYPGAYTGRLVFAKTPQEALEKIQPGDILVTSKTTPEWTIVFPKLSAIIVDVGGVLSHTAIVGREQRIPTLLSTADATKQLAEWDGKIVTLDATNSVVYEGALELTCGNIKDFIREELQNSNFVQDLEMQTHRIDEEGKWMSRPNMALTPMQLQFLQNAYDDISDILELSEPIYYKVIGNRIYVQIEDADGRPGAYAKTTEVLLKWGLARLEGLFDDRVETVREFTRFAENFEATPEQLRQFKTLYQHWMVHFLSRGRFGHGAVAILMQQMMNQIPDPAILSSYLHLRYPTPNESNEKQHEHLRISKQLIELGCAKDSSFEKVKAMLQKEHPLLWKQIVEFATNYEHISSENMTAPVPIDQVLKQLLMTLGDVEFDYSPIQLTAGQIAQMDLLFGQNTDLARVMVLAHRHLYQKENEHHQIARSQHRIYEELLSFGRTLVQRGLLAAPDQVFERNIEDLAMMAEAPHLSNGWLNEQLSYTAPAYLE